MKRIVSALLPFLLGPLFLAGPGLCLEIVYPEDGTFFPRSNFLILKGGDSPPLEGITIEINGVGSDIIDISGPDYRAAFGDFLILQPSFDPGRNVIVAEGYAGGEKVSTARAEVFFLNDVSLVPPEDYRPFTMHLPEKEVLCAPCHEMKPDPVEIKMAEAESNPCASCHRRMLNKSYVHGPAGVYQCTYCHEPDSRPGKYQPRAEGAELCNECHLDKVREFKKNEYVHGPVEVGYCQLCHDAHASDQPAQLLGSVNAVCLGCHSKIESEPHVVRGVLGKGHPVEGMPDPSRPGRLLSCASCHDPHGGASSYLFQQGIKGRFGLCGLCHDK